ncbi:MAG: tyrosine-type recombinase/integrase [Candidatus Omnitrophota bacterium]
MPTETAGCLREYLEEQGIDARKPVTVFFNHLGTPLSRFGIRYLLTKYLRKVYPQRPSLQKKRLHPHSLRHSLAMHLLKSGVDLCSIANWLGHVSVVTTNKYVTLDLDMKRQALAKAQPLVETTGNSKSWRQDPDIIAWLESL